jgi:hypothetical protein
LPSPETQAIAVLRLQLAIVGAHKSKCVVQIVLGKVITVLAELFGHTGSGLT